MSWWVKLRAAARFVTLPLREPSKAERVARICAKCATLRLYEEEGAVSIPFFGKVLPYTGFCGPSPDDGEPVEGEHCCCLVLAQRKPHEPPLVGLTVRGRNMEPAGKTAREERGCPQGKW